LYSSSVFKETNVYIYISAERQRVLFCGNFFFGSHRLYGLRKKKKKTKRR